MVFRWFVGRFDTNFDTNAQGLNPRTAMGTFRGASRLSTALQLRFDVINARHEIGDRVDDVMGAGLMQTLVCVLSWALLFVGRQCVPVVERQANLVAAVARVRARRRLRSTSAGFRWE